MDPLLKQIVILLILGLLIILLLAVYIIARANGVGA